jgi:uncharacterized protein (TIGR02996 family)
MSFRELLDAVLADEANDAPRLVLADWLTEHGDPRGALITAQLRGDEKRAQSLVKKHYAELLGPIADFTIKKDVRFARGFLHALPLILRGDPGEIDRLLACAADPRWSTVRELSVYQPSGALLDFFTHPNLGRLASLVSIDCGVVNSFAIRPSRPALRRLGIAGSLLNVNLDLLSSAFPLLTSITLFAHEPEMLHAHPLALRLVELRMLHVAPNITARALQAPPNIHRVTFGDVIDDVTVTLSRQDGEPFRRLELRQCVSRPGAIPGSIARARYTLREFGSILPRGSIVEVDAPPSLATEFAAEIAALQRTD